MADDTATTAPARRLPPVWLLGLTYLPFGGSGAVALITIPQLLAARHVPQPEIASITAFSLIPTFGSFLLAPILDVWFSRRSYAVGFALLSAVLGFAALASLDNLFALRWLMFASILAGALFVPAVGGWFGGIVAHEDAGRLGAWLAVANIGGFGVTAYAAITLLRGLPYTVGAAIMCVAITLPIAIFAWVPAPPPDRRLASESFGQFFADLRALIRKPAVVRTLILFVPPGASFALTNSLGGLGGDFGASEQFVALVAGIGVTVAGVIGSLAVPKLARRAPLGVAYLIIGALGAGFTLSLLLMPRTPTVFAVALIGENVFQAAAFAVQYAIVIGGIGKDNPLAATQYAFLLAAQALPITYMQWLDGQAYGAGELTASLTTDAGMGLIACAVLGLLVWRWRTR